MPGILEDKDRIFTNLYGFQDWGIAARGTPPPTSFPAVRTGSSTR